MLADKTKAPEFALPDQNNKIHTLSDYRGKWVVVYFYPKDNTPGCTKEACGFRDRSQQYVAKKVVILGISKDSIASHQKFAQKYHLNFPLLSDPDKQVLQAYGVWGVKKMMGREFESTKRSTYIIDPHGKIFKSFASVNPLTHAQEILTAIQS